MKLLQLAQHSKEEAFADRKYINGKLSSKPFNRVAKEFPDCLIEINDEDSFPGWGYGWYKRGRNGEIVLHKQNWDSSG